MPFVQPAPEGTLAVTGQSQLHNVICIRTEISKVLTKVTLLYRSLFCVHGLVVGQQCAVYALVGLKSHLASPLSRQMGPFTILLCLTPDDFTYQCEKSHRERVNVVLD